jgi:hypothetical protein
MAITNLSTSSLVSGVKRRRVWDQTATTDGFFQIATTTLNVDASSITFSSIPQNYTHLQLRLSTKTNRSNAGIDDMVMRFNSDSGTNYSIHGIYEYSGVYSFGNANTNYLTVQGASSTNTVANVLGVSIIDLLDYSITNKFKTVRILSGTNNNVTSGTNLGITAFNSGNWRNTAAVTSITLTPATGTSYVQYSSASLYGIKG